jgi:hypothetical protein
MENGVNEVAVYECSGLRISSPFPLPAPVLIGVRPDAVDVAIEMGESTSPPYERPSTDVVAELLIEGRPRYSICRVDDDYVCRIAGVGDFSIDADFRHVRCHPTIGGWSDVIPIVITGTITAFILAMGGQFVLHGSAVELDGKALAFVGESGQGKSTMAALFCAFGASLVTDDVLPLEFEVIDGGGNAVRCLRSGNEIRLREKSASITDRFDKNVSVRITADERLAVQPSATAIDRIPLIAVLLPRPDREHSTASARALPPGEASYWLSRCQRIEGWQDREHLRSQFLDVGRVVASIPTYEVFVPWGPPFADDLPEQVLAACGLNSALAATDPMDPI